MEADPKPQPQEKQLTNQPCKAPNRISYPSRKLMTTSVEIESEINNLFESTDNFISYYSRNQETLGTKNSILCKVVE
jgi:hypothetical protein